MNALATPLRATVTPETTPRPLDTIRTVLKRDVAEVLHQHLPALAMVPAEKVYDRVLDDPALLHQSFRLLRSRPELFKDVVVTPERAFPSADGDVLFCGRTLSEIIALVVRACARRYFKKRFAPSRRPTPARRSGPGLFRSMAIALGLAAKPKPRPASRPVASAGERLYTAIAELLLYDWQVPLIPAYAELSPQTITALGPRLLDYRDSLSLQVLSDHVAAAQLVNGKIPLLLDDSKRLLVNDGTGVNAEALWTVSQKMQISALFMEWDTSEMRRAVSMVSATAPAALQVLDSVLGRDIRAFTLFLFTAYGKLGSIRYKQVFGPEGQTWVVRALVERMRHEPVSAPSLDLMKRKMESLLEGAVDNALAAKPN